MKHRLTFKKYDSELCVGVYAADRKTPALTLVGHPDSQYAGEPIATLSVYVPGVPAGHVAIKNWSGHEEAPARLEAAGVIGPRVGGIPTGFCEAQIHPLLARKTEP